MRVNRPTVFRIAIVAILAIAAAAVLLHWSSSGRVEVFDPTPTSTSEVVLATGSSQENVLKGLKVDYDAASGEVHAVGTLHGANAVVAVGTSPTYSSSWQLGAATAFDSYQPKFPVFDSGTSRVWTVGRKAGSGTEHTLFVSDATSGVLDETYHTSLALPSSYDAVQLAAVDSTTGYLYAASDDGSGNVRTVTVWEYSAGLSVVATFSPAGDGTSGKPNEAIADMVWDEADGALALLILNEDANEVVLRYGEPSTSSGTLKMSYDSCMVTQPGFTDPVRLLRITESGAIYVAGANVLAKLERTTSGSNCSVTRTVTTNTLTQGPTDMAVSEATNTVALLYHYDTSPDLSITPYTGTKDVIFSWIDLYEDDGASLLYKHLWRAGLESTSIVATESDADIEFAVGAGGEGTVRMLPIDHSAQPVAVQLSTSPEYVLLADDSSGNRMILALSRLAGSQLIVSPAVGSGISCSYNSPETVGFWPVGMAKSGNALYILSHFDRSFHILDLQKVADCETGVLIAQLSLPAQIIPSSKQPNPDYQVADALSALASSSNGRLHAALLNEAGEMHLVDCRSGPCVVAQSESIFPDRDTEAGPGRAQAAIKIDPSSKLSTVFVYKKDVEELEVWQESTPGHWISSGTESVLTSDVYVDVYATDALFYSINTPGRLYLYNRIYDFSTGSLSYIEAIVSPWLGRPPVVHRVVAVDPNGLVWGTYFNSSTGQEELRGAMRSSRLPSLPTWRVNKKYVLFPTYSIRSGFYLEYGGVDYDAVFSQPHEGKLFYRSGL